ncbi:hypothetical protein RND81_04G087600 [Saponaria officinalis]|uniref:CCHC-type domain-containing protein n=1 Tax=Saponaria officinalis TaxID=3572 RepID=A0AAW1LK07_SAPOF
MLNIAKLEFVALDITGKKYLSWVLDAEIHLDDLKSVSEYNSATFRITSQLRLCGGKITDIDMLEKIYSTFHANNVVLQTQYREKGFTKYHELISCFLVAKQNNELLMKNYESRPTDSTPLPEANVTSYNEKGHYRDHASSSGRGRGGYFKKIHSHMQWNRKDSKCEKDKSENVTNKCYHCGAKGHWSHVCFTPKHLVNLYLQSVKQKRKNVETNMVIEDGEGDFDSGDTTHLEVVEIFPIPKGN